MMGDNFKPVSQETSEWVLRQHFALQEIPIDVCGPISQNSMASEKQFDENLKALRAQGRLRSEAHRLGIDISEMPLYRAYRAMGLFPEEAVNSIIVGRRKK